MHCKLCGSEDVVMVEFQGAYDGWMALSCIGCGKQTHRMNGIEIVHAIQRPDYGPVDFLLKDGRKFVNLFEEFPQ